MNINLVICNAALLGEEAPQEKVIVLDDKATIQQLLDAAGCIHADLSHYYPFSGAFTWNDPFLPYLFTGGKVIYFVSFEDAQVKDFLYTHSIADNTIRVTTGYPWAGGPGFLPLEQIWENAFHVLNTIAVFVTISGFSLKDLFCYLRDRFLPIQQPPQSCFDIVFSRQKWNSSELAKLLDIEHERAKELLKVFGYQYSRKQQQYIQGEKAEEIREKLSNVKSFDIQEEISHSV